MARSGRSQAFLAVREAILELSDEERLYLRAWIVRYVNRWGQVPTLASERASKNINPVWGNIPDAHDR
jgi:hypothetical protein